MLGTKLLIAYDGSDLANNALDKTIEIATSNPAIEVDVLHIIKLPQAPFLVDKAFEDMQESMHVHSDRLLSEAKERLSTISNTCHFYEKEGDPSHAILTHVNDYGCDLILMGSRGLSVMREFLGSVSHHVVQHSSVPVFVVK